MPFTSDISFQEFFVTPKKKTKNAHCLPGNSPFLESILNTTDFQLSYCISYFKRLVKNKQKPEHLDAGVYDTCIKNTANELANCCSVHPVFRKRKHSS